MTHAEASFLIMCQNETGAMEILDADDDLCNTLPWLRGWLMADDITKYDDIIYGHKYLVVDCSKVDGILSDRLLRLGHPDFKVIADYKPYWFYDLQP